MLSFRTPLSFAQTYFMKKIFPGIFSGLVLKNMTLLRFFCCYELILPGPTCTNVSLQEAYQWTCQVRPPLRTVFEEIDFDDSVSCFVFSDSALSASKFCRH